MNANLFYYSKVTSCGCILRRKLSQFYAEDRFCDIAVHVQQQIFRCHRVVLASVSEYFDALFRNNVEDCRVQQTVLLDINAGVFEEILTFSYSEKEPSLSNSNVYDVLRASDFLGMQSLMKCCVDYIRQHKSSIENIFEVFSFAHATNNESLKETLCYYIITKFNKLSRKEEFLTMSVEALKMVLKKYEPPCKFYSELSLSRMFRDENILLDALIRWVKYSSGERAVHLKEILEVVNFRKISPCYQEFLMKEFKIDRIVDDASLEKDLCGYLLSNDSISDDFVNASPVVCKNISKLGLHVYMDFISDDDDSALNIFSTHKYKSKWSLCCRKDPSPLVSAYMKVISFGESPNYLYSLRYPLSVGYAPTFFASTSVTLDLKQRLASPPTTFLGGLFDICGMPNSTSIYLCYVNEYTTQISQVNYYDCQIDKWFPVTELSAKMTESCMVADNNLLYFIGGSINDDKSGRCVQAYDKRVPKWLKLSRTNRSYSHAAGTSLNGKIYVSDAHSIEVLDPAAGRWETLSCAGPNNNKEIKQFEQKKLMVAYENQLWTICSELRKSGEERNGTYSYYYVHAFDPEDKIWASSRSLNEIKNRHTEYETDIEGYYEDDYGTEYSTGENHRIHYSETSVEGFVVF